jgi:hypothetical protein
MPNINTLIQDIYNVIDKKGGWDATVSEFFREDISNVVDARLQDEEQPRGTLRLSNLGTPCKRKLWYSVNTPDEAEPLRPSIRLKFLYGDMLESLLLALAQAAGHDVKGMQDELYVAGIKGHRDAVIDGITVDVKSASGYGFRKFEGNNLWNDDPFGYLSQLSSYVYAGHKANPDGVHPTIGAFLVIDKQSGELCLDTYDLTSLVTGKEEEAEHLKNMVSGDTPERAFKPVKDGGSGNMKLPVNCSYCDFKAKCWPEMRTFLYSNGPRFLTTVARTPNVPEVK